MSSASAVRAGHAFVELSADDTKFQRTVKNVHNTFHAIGSAAKRIGTNMVMAGGAMGLPMLLAARSAATFEDALLELKGAAADVSSGDLKRVREEALRLSKALSIDPAQAARAFTLLIKAGMPVEEALGGAAKAAIEFAKVAEVDAPVAAEFMKVAMNVFGISAEQAANTLSAAADASETSIAAMVEGFSQVGSVAKGTGQSLFGLSQGMAVLARYGIKGEEAGTGLKTVLLKLLAPTADAKQALGSLGLSMESFTDETGKLLPMAQIAGIFADKLGGMEASARDAMLANEALVKVFDVRGIKIIKAFVDAGREGFDRTAKAMEDARSVSDKYAIAMEGLSGSMNAVVASVQRLAVSFASAAAPAFRLFANVTVPVIDALGWLLANVPFLSSLLAGTAAVLFVAGAAFVGVGTALMFINLALKGFLVHEKAFVAGMARMRAAAVLTANTIRAAMVKMGPVGWALLAAGLGYSIYEMMSGSGSPTGTGVKRDDVRKSLGETEAAGPAAASSGTTETRGTFSGSILGQIGVGPALRAAEATAENTGRMVELMEGGIASASTRVPSGDAAAATVAASAPVSARGVAVSSDRDLVSATERAAIAAEKSHDLLRQILGRNGSPLVFA